MAGPKDWELKLRDRLMDPKNVPVPAGAEALSAVLVPIGFHKETGRDEILLMKRTMLVETHKGQISFPGGFREPQDETLLHTALRESEEEIGTRLQDVKVLGGLNPVRTRGDVLIYPWVATFPFPYPFVLSTGEVERLVYLPLQRLIDEGLGKHKIDVGAFKIESPGIVVEGELVWGATARMLEELRRHLLP